MPRKARQLGRSGGTGGHPAGRCAAGGGICRGGKPGGQGILCSGSGGRRGERAGKRPAHRAAGAHRYRLRVCVRPRCPHGGKGAGRGGRCCRSGAQPGRRHPVCLRPRQPLHLGGGRRCPGADRRGTGLHRCLCRSAGLSRSAGCGYGRYAVHQLPLGAQQLAGKERRQHPAAGHCPAGGAEYAGAAVPVHRRGPLRRGSEPCHRGLGADLYRPCTGQLRGGVSGGK